MKWTAWTHTDIGILLYGLLIGLVFGACIGIEVAVLTVDRDWAAAKNVLLEDSIRRGIW